MKKFELKFTDEQMSDIVGKLTVSYFKREALIKIDKGDYSEEQKEQIFALMYASSMHLFRWLNEDVTI